MKHLIWIALTAALVSFTVAEQFSKADNARHYANVSSGSKTASGIVENTSALSIERYLSELRTAVIPKDSVIVVADGYSKTGVASYYANKFHGRRTSSGAIYHKDSLTAAHKTLKFGTIIRVTNLSNDSTIVVKVTDRMGKTSHILDLSEAGAKQLGFLRAGIAKVKIEEVTYPQMIVAGK
jgi:rare lipoprotein A